MALEIREVGTRRELRRFIRIAQTLYADDPNWVAPVTVDRLKLFDRKKNPLWGRADYRGWTAIDSGRPVGRISAIDFPAHNEIHGEKIGFFGFFESINDTNVTRTLFDTAESWLRDRGLSEIRGPFNPTINDECGLLVDGFDDPPQVLMTYNPDYYESLIKSVGFRPVKDLYAWRLTPDFLSAKLERVRNAVVDRYRVSTRSFRFSPKSAFQEDVALLRRLYNEGWQANWGAIQLTDEEFDFVAADLKMIADRDLVRIVDVAGEPAGFVLALPDINEALASNRRGGIVGAGIALAFRKGAISRGRIILLGLLPRFRGRGIDAALYFDIGHRMVDTKGYREAEASWVLEENDLMNRAIKMMGGERYKIYRIFEKSMNEN